MKGGEGCMGRPAVIKGETNDEQLVVDLTVPNTSDRIRSMLDEGMLVSEIAKKLHIRYNFAYNVASIYIDQKYQVTVKEFCDAVKHKRKERNEKH